MNNRISSLMFATAISCLSFGCSQTSSSFSEPTPDNMQHKPSEGIKQHQSVDLKWLHYSDPRADANLAIQKQDFNLLAFAGRVTSFPGIDGGSPSLQQQCGYRLLANSSDAMRSENQLNLRKQLYQYAAAYNQLVAAACQKNN
jgi:hypothetical protein